MYKVEEMITCKKRIERKQPIQYKSDYKYLRADLPLIVNLEGIQMDLIFRRLISLPNTNFTIGLRLLTPNPFCDFCCVLLRYQGPHGGQSPLRNAQSLHNDYHIHFFSQDDLDHRRKMASVQGKRIAPFSSFEEAIFCILKDCNIEDPNDIFRKERESLMQLRMEFPD